MNPRLTAGEALERLKQGNRRFVEGCTRSDHRSGPQALVRSDAPQNPIAIILGCSDSRVPAELVFDQGLGDLFVIRVAGNVVAPSQVDSVEFAASQFGTRLVVVLGHTQCGAVLATLDEIGRPAEERSTSLRAIVNRVKPAVEDLMSADHVEDHETLVERAVRANIRASVQQLKAGSQGIMSLVGNGDLEIVGAEYSLETGVVDFFENTGEKNFPESRRS